MTYKRAWAICISVSVVIVALGRALLALDFDLGLALLFPGTVIQMFLVDGFHGNSDSRFLTELCLEGVSLIVWSVVAFGILFIFELIKDFVLGKR